MTRASAATRPDRAPCKILLAGLLPLGSPARQTISICNCSLFFRAIDNLQILIKYKQFEAVRRPPFSTQEGMHATDVSHRNARAALGGLLVSVAHGQERVRIGVLQ